MRDGDGWVVMSQANRSRVATAVRHRQQMADSLLAAGVPGMYPGPAARPSDPLFFDVRAAREHALTLVRGYADNVYDRRRCDLGLRLIEALRGQSGECQAGCWASFNSGVHKVDVKVMGDPQGGCRACPDCRGTGHNLRGTLPPIVWSPAVRRRAKDAEAHRTRRVAVLEAQGTDWLPALGLAGCYGCTGAPETRVVPRGEHADICARADALFG